MTRSAALVLLAILAAEPAAAELPQADAAGFLVQHSYSIAAGPAQSWNALIHPELWWPDDHTWSGSRANLSLVAEAGGCFCERWPAGSAEHARVVMALPGQLLRLRGSLGPLQEMALDGVLTVVLTPSEAGTEASVSYRVSGDSAHRLEGIAGAVDKVIGLQFGAFAGYVAQAAQVVIEPVPGGSRP